MSDSFGYVRVATAVPEVQAGAVRDNLASMLGLARDAARQGCDVVVYPELAITGYTCADLFAQRLLLDAARAALMDFTEATAGLAPAFAVGLPLAVDGRLFNVAALIQGGRVRGVVPKTYLPSSHEFYESRWFVPGTDRVRDQVDLPGGAVPFGIDLLFRAEAPSDLCLGIEICEDLWAPVPPSSLLALAGATLLINLSASNDLAGKADYRLELVRQQSARCLAGYAYCSAGVGESTTDTVFGGDCILAENGAVLARSEPFRRQAHLTIADLDMAFVQHERQTCTSFAQAGRGGSGSAPGSYREIRLDTPRAAARHDLRRAVSPRPFIPADPAARHRRCQEIFAIQSTGLATRLHHVGATRVHLGLSGGLDSTLALLVCLEAFARLGLSKDGIRAVTMPGFGTTHRTRNNAELLCAHLGLNLDTIPIAASCRQQFADIGHDGTTADVTYENVQARQRTQILMNRANLLGGLVIGTGDLSELALGWCTYNGDHMSMYGVNAGVPKTLVRYLIDYYAEDKADPATAAVLHDILDTPISPELLPPDDDGRIAQKTEAVVGPYELHDFFLYYAIRCGFAPRKVLFLAEAAFRDTYPPETLRRWLRTFLGRFFSQQFKRSCLPDGPKVGTIALSPRGDWRMPSDASAAAWLADLDGPPTA